MPPITHAEKQHVLCEDICSRPATCIIETLSHFRYLPSVAIRRAVCWQHARQRCRGDKNWQMIVPEPEDGIESYYTAYEMLLPIWTLVSKLYLLESDKTRRFIQSLLPEEIVITRILTDERDEKRWIKVIRYVEVQAETKPALARYRRKLGVPGGCAPIRRFA